MNEDFEPTLEQPTNTVTQNRTLIEVGMIKEKDNLLRGIRIYVSRFGLVHEFDSLEQAAEDIFSETFAAAIESAEHYDPVRPLNAWILGIAINKLRDRRKKMILERKNVILISDHNISDDPASTISEEELFERIESYKDSASTEPLSDLLGLVNEDDRKILELAFVYGIKGKALAQHLKISEGAAHVRLHRAIQRLRTAYFREQG